MEILDVNDTYRKLAKEELIERIEYMRNTMDIYEEYLEEDIDEFCILDLCKYIDNALDEL